MPYLAIQSFAGPDNRMVLEGEEIGDDDPIVKGRESLFAKIDEPLPKGPTSYGPDVEAKPARGRRAQKKAEGSA